MVGFGRFDGFLNGLKEGNSEKELQQGQDTIHAKYFQGRRWFAGMQSGDAKQPEMQNDRITFLRHMYGNVFQERGTIIYIF